jgi:hypothetical protein
MVVQVEIFQKTFCESILNYIKMNDLPRSNVQPIRFIDEGRAATRELLSRFDGVAPSWEKDVGHLRIAALRSQLAMLEQMDRQYGGDGPLDLEGVDTLVGSVLTELAHFQNDLRHAAADEPLADIVLAVALWSIRHAVEIPVVEPVVNALAYRSNQARSRHALAAAFSLMQGLIAHVAPRLAPDLERSNPERPWRLLHLNLAITAIRTEDPAMMDYAFDALESALPDERAGFFAEALARALAPGISPEVRSRIEMRHLKWTRDA